MASLIRLWIRYPVRLGDRYRRNSVRRSWSIRAQTLPDWGNQPCLTGEAKDSAAELPSAGTPTGPLRSHTVSVRLARVARPSHVIRTGSVSLSWKPDPTSHFGHGPDVDAINLSSPSGNPQRSEHPQVFYQTYQTYSLEIRRTDIMMTLCIGADVCKSFASFSLSRLHSSPFCSSSLRLSLLRIFTVEASFKLRPFIPTVKLSI